MKEIKNYLKRRIEECRDLAKAKELSFYEQGLWAARAEALEGVYLTFFDNRCFDTVFKSHKNEV